MKSRWDYLEVRGGRRDEGRDGGKQTVFGCGRL